MSKKIDYPVICKTEAIADMLEDAIQVGSEPWEDYSRAIRIRFMNHYKFLCKYVRPLDQGAIIHNLVEDLMNVLNAVEGGEDDEWQNDIIKGFDSIHLALESMVTNIRKRYKADDYEAYIMSNFKGFTQGKFYSLEQLFTEAYIIKGPNERDFKKFIQKAKKWVAYKNGDRPSFI